jgi:hypothetical protein
MIFKCKKTGNTVEFIAEHDVEAMKQHPDYEVVSESKTKTTSKKKSSWLDKDV